MNNVTLKLSVADFGGLPARITTPNGAVFDPRLDRWCYRDSLRSVSLDFTALKASKELILSAKRVLVWYAENKSSDHLINMFVRLDHFLAFLGDDDLASISSAHLLNYRGSLASRNSWYLGSLSGLLQKWHRLKFPGITEDSASLLKQLRIKGNQKGKAILTMDPEHGPFTDIELESIHQNLQTAYAKGGISLSNYVLAWLFMALGQRSIQYAALKVCDVGVAEVSEGARTYTLRVPRAKQRGQLSRGLFTNRVLIPQIGSHLVQLANEVRGKFVSKLKDPDQAPLFPAKLSRRNEPTGFEYHRTADSVAETLVATINLLKVISERTGKPLHVTATRFRRTVGTRAAVEGHGELVIAELLDHTDTQNVGVYVQAVPEIIERIDRAVAFHMAPLAQAFAGMIIEDESQATRCNDSSSRICDPRFDPSMKAIGNCGDFGYCSALAPIACYTCRSFQPWLDGPHEAVLDYLLTERERLLNSSDARIASINDRTILAVAEVVRQCRDIFDSRGGANG